MKGWDVLEEIVRGLRRIASVTVLLGHSQALCPVTINSSRDITILQDLDDADMPSFYRAADWLLSTSRWEGFGLAIAEALACGTPVLVPESLGTGPELLDTVGGHTYQDPEHLAALLTRGSRPAAPLRRPFDWSTNADTTIAIYRELTQVGQRCASC
jgi:glycosyltransferase involved in cell wall biosynthesis